MAAEVVLPRRDLVRLADAAADREHGRPRLLGHRLAPLGRIIEEDARARRRVDGLLAAGEGGAAAQHDVELLVPAGAAAALVVRLDDVLARLRRVGVDPERADP